MERVGRMDMVGSLSCSASGDEEGTALYSFPCIPEEEEADLTPIAR